MVHAFLSWQVLRALPGFHRALLLPASFWAPSAGTLVQFVGYSQDSRLPAEFDVTELLSPGGDNVLAVQVRYRQR